MEDNDRIEKTEQIQGALLEAAELPEIFDAELFCELIETIIVQSNTKIRFRLINGIELPESIGRTVR